MKKFSLALLPFVLTIAAAIVLAPSAFAAASHPHGYRLYCASNDFYQHFCPADTDDGVDLIRQRSEAPCVYGRTWGISRGGIWVDRGCRADFAIGFRGRDYARSYRGSRIVYCASNDLGFNDCRVNTDFGVQILRQRSEAPCIYGRTWGYDERGIWVDRGCRADFQLGGRSFRYRDRDGDFDDRPF